MVPPGVRFAVQTGVIPAKPAGQQIGQSPSRMALGLGQDFGSSHQRGGISGSSGKQYITGFVHQRVELGRVRQPGLEKPACPQRVAVGQ